MNYARPLEQMIPIRDLNDIRIIESVPWESRNLPKTPLQILRHSARAFGDNTAIEYISSATDNSPVFSLTYSKFYDRVMRIANLFDRLGIGKDDVVSMLLPNLPHTHYILWGAQAAGIVNPINPFLESSQIAAIMRKAGTKILVVLSPDYDPDIWTKTMQAVNGVPQVETLFIVDEQRLYSNKPSCVLNEIRDRNELRENIALLDLDDEMNAVKPEQVRERASDEITAYFHTGGTTGMPKLAMWAGSNQVYMAWTIATIGHFSNASAGLCGLPLFHASAVMVTGLAPFLAGAKVIIATASGCRNPDVIKNFWKLVEQSGATYFNGVPTIYSALLNVPVADADITSLEVAFCGAAPMSTELLHRVENEFGISLLEAYGLTEATTVANANPIDGQRRVGSIGLRVPYTEVKAARIDATGKYISDCAFGETGTILIKGPGVFRGYKDEATGRDVFAAPGWLNSGDLGYQDSDGYFWLTGRAKDLIIRGGHNIDPSIIEEALAKHPAIDMVAAVGLPDARVGELPMVFYTLRNKVPIYDADLRNHMQNVISERAALPVRYEQLKSMPMTAVGKIFKPALRANAALLATEDILAAQGITARISAHYDTQYGVVVNITIPDISERNCAKSLMQPFTFRIQWTPDYAEEKNHA